MGVPPRTIFTADRSLQKQKKIKPQGHTAILQTTHTIMHLFELLAKTACEYPDCKAFIDAESYEGVSLIIAYSPCIAHGFDMIDNHKQQQLAVNTGHWPLFRFDPRKAEKGINPLHLDSKPPSIPYSEFVKSEARFSMLWRSHPEVAQRLLGEAQHEVSDRFDRYQQLSKMEWDVDEPDMKTAAMKERPAKDKKGDA